MFSSGYENNIFKTLDREQKQIINSEQTSPTYTSCFGCLNLFTKKQNNQVQKSQLDKMVIINQGFNTLCEAGESLEKSITDQSQQQIVQTHSQNKLSKYQKVKDFPLNKLFILKSKASNTSIIAKITEKRFKLDDERQESNTQQFPQQHFHQSQNYSPYDSWRQTTPEVIAQYIATRVSGHSLIVDLGCGIGGNTIQVVNFLNQFAKTCDFVISVDIDLKSLQYAQSRAIQFEVESKVEFLYANLLNLRKLRADTVFVNPTINEDLPSIDIFRDCSPNIFSIMDKAFHIAPNLIMQLPKNIDLTQLPAIFNLQRYPHLHHSNCEIEIEILYINKIVEYYIVYFGQFSRINDDEYNIFLLRELQKKGLVHNGLDISNKVDDLIRLLKQNIGGYKVFEFIINSLEQCPQNQPIFQYIVNNAYSNSYINKDQMYSFISHQQTNICKQYIPVETITISAESLHPDKTLHTPLTNSEQQNKLKQIYSSPQDLQIISASDCSYRIDNLIKGCGDSLNKIYYDITQQNKDENKHYNFELKQANQQIEEVKFNYA